jgi:hypothetical protein
MHCYPSMTTSTFLETYEIAQSYQSVKEMENAI